MVARVLRRSVVRVGDQLLPAGAVLGGGSGGVRVVKSGVLSLQGRLTVGVGIARVGEICRFGSTVGVLQPNGKGFTPPGASPQIC